MHTTGYLEQGSIFHMLTVFKVVKDVLEMKSNDQYSNLRQGL